MRNQSVRAVCAVAVTVLVPMPVATQDLPRTAWGDPDLRGIWTNTTTTPLERPDDLAGQEMLTNEERIARDEERARNADRPPPPGQTGAYNDFWFERGTLSTRTSLIVDPTDGKLPLFTPTAADRAETIRVRRYSSERDSVDSFHLYDRCLTRAMPGTMMPGFYNHNYNILQTSDYVVIQVEMIHDTRIIPLDGRSHISPTIRQWLGNSRGYWDDDTLVVETKNYSPYASVMGAADNLHVTERFTRVSEDVLQYEVTLDDPTTWTEPWTAMIPLKSSSDALFEYACHEGNIGMEGILAGARHQEAEEAGNQ